MPRTKLSAAGARTLLARDKPHPLDNTTFFTREDAYTFGDTHTPRHLNYTSPIFGDHDDMEDIGWDGDPPASFQTGPPGITGRITTRTRHHVHPLSRLPRARSETTSTRWLFQMIAEAIGDYVHRLRNDGLPPSRKSRVSQMTLADYMAFHQIRPGDLPFQISLTRIVAILIKWKDDRRRLATEPYFHPEPASPLEEFLWDFVASSTPIPPIYTQWDADGNVIHASTWAADQPDLEIDSATLMSLTSSITIQFPSDPSWSE